MTKKLTRSLALTAALLASTAFDAPAQTVIAKIPIDPRGSFLRLCPVDAAVDPTIIDLPTLGVGPGDLLSLSCLGYFKYRVYNRDETATGMLGVFSRSTELGPKADRFRVIGAIDAGVHHVTRPLRSCANPARDIPEDFLIPPDGVVVRVPTNALYLFVTAADYYFDDNSDPTGDFVLRISRQSDPRLTVTVSQCRVCWSSQSNVLYRVDYKSTVTTNAWTPLVSRVVGNGTTNCVLDSVTDEKEILPGSQAAVRTEWTGGKREGVKKVSVPGF